MHSAIEFLMLLCNILVTFSVLNNRETESDKIGAQRGALESGSIDPLSGSPPVHAGTPD